MRSRFGTAGRLLVVATTGTMLLSSCFWGSEDEPDAERRSTGPPRSAGPCKDANPAPPVTPDLNPAECRWWASAEDVVGFDDLVIITEEEQPGRFTMSAIRAETGQPLWATPPIEAVADRAKGGERALQVVHWQGKPYAAFQHQTGKGSAVTFVPLSRDGDRIPVTWSASETDSEVPHALAARDDVSAAVVVGVVPQPWDVIDPTSGTTTRLPTSASEAVQAVGDGWFAEGNVDGFTFTIKRYDGSLAWDPATVVPEGANPTGSRDVIAAYGDYLLARWIKAADPGTPGTGAGSWLLAVHGKDGKPVATTEFGAFGDEDPTDETTTEPADRMVVSSDQRWLAVHSGKNTAAIDLTGGKAVTLEPGLLPFSVTDDGVVYAVSAAGAAVSVNGRTGKATWTGDVGSLLPATVVDGVGVVSSTSPATVLAGRHATATTWAFGSGRAVTAERLAPMVWLADGDESGPTDASLFLAHSRLMWAHDQDCESDLIAQTVDEAALASGAYRHRIAVNRHPVGLGVPVTCPEQDHIGREYRSNENTHPHRSEDVPGREGFYLDLDDNYREGLGPGAPMYWEFHPGENGKDAYVYWLFYAYNDYTNKHEGDWERIAVQVDGDTPTGVTLWKHEQPACVVPWAGLEWTEDGHPIIYSAKNAHGSYPHEGRYRHPGGVDETSKGRQWHTWDNAREVKAQRWYGYGGGWGAVAPIEFFSGPDGPNPLYDKAAPALTESRCDVPKEFAGVWTSSEPISPPIAMDTRVSVTIEAGAVGETVGSVTYPQASCTGQLQAVESTSDKLVSTQLITDDPRQVCAKAGTVTLTRDGDVLNFSFQEKGKQTTHTARLQKR